MFKRLVLPVLLLFAVAGCDSDDDGGGPVQPSATGLVVVESNTSVSATFGQLDQALQAAPPVSVVARVDHAANAQSAGLSLRPTRVILFGNPALGTPIMRANQQAGIDLPQKFLVYEEAEGRTVVGYNSTDYLAQRHNVGGVATLDQIEGALAMFAETAAGGTVSAPGAGSVSAGEGLVSVQSTSDAATTFGRLRAAVEANANLTIVAELDHQANAASVGMELRPTRLLVFGNPALGTPLMQAAQTIGIDLPQKVLVYTDAAGDTFVLYNDPVYLAERHGADGVSEQTTAIAGALATLAAAAAGS